MGGAARYFTYDALGNLIGRDLGTASGQNQFYGHATKPHAITGGPGGQSYAYDADGNMTDRAGQTLVWDSENRLVCAQQGGDCTAGFDVRYGYALDGTRLW